MMPSAANSTIRRHRAAERKKRKLRRIAMRTCESCIRHGGECIVPKGQPRCTACDKTNRQCDLAPPGKEYEKTQDVIEKLDEEELALQQKLARIRKQRRFHLKKLGDMGDREAQNILELEADERSEVPAPDLPILSDFPVDFDWSSVSFPVGEIVAGGPGSSQGS